MKELQTKALIGILLDITIKQSKKILWNSSSVSCLYLKSEYSMQLIKQSGVKYLKTTKWRTVQNRRDF